jgi:FAD/FMN-containing dehydrogenase
VVVLVNGLSICSVLILTVLGDVGVGGLTLGGGLSFLSTQYGLVCDNIENYEVILADASIVNANTTSNTDLF